MANSKISSHLANCAAIVGLMFIWLGGKAAAMEFIVAGVPKPMVEDRNYASVFSTLKKHGITGFYPTFQFEEVPAPRSLGYEGDFVAPCKASDRGVKAVKQSGIKLLLPAELIYPNPAKLASLSSAKDPLLRIIACVGRKNILGITNYDEAAFHGTDIAAVRALYDHVKVVAPKLPVYMVHGPIVMDKPEFSSHSKRERYLDKVRQYSTYSDVTGFDVYPVPDLIAKLATPLSRGEIVPASETADGYMKWMKQNLVGKRMLMVLQGFGYKHLYQPTFLKKNIPTELQELARAPSTAELHATVASAKKYGIDTIVWWGQAALRDSGEAPWPSLLGVSKAFTR